MSSSLCVPETGSATDALSYRIGGLFGILAFSIVGFSLPIIFVGRFRFVFFLFQTFSAGVVAAVGVIHVFPDAIDTMTNPCLALSEFPLAPTITLFAIIVTFMFEHTLGLHLAHSATHNVDVDKDAEKGMTIDGEGGEETQLTPEQRRWFDIQQLRVVAYTLETGIVFHSFFVGLLLGVTRDVGFAKALCFALLFHQGFEGLALGASLAKAEVAFSKIIVCGILFSFTTPVGVAIGLGLGNAYDSTNKAWLLFEGIINSIAAGILIYNGLMDLIVPAFQQNKGLVNTISGYISLLLGAGAMAVIGKWA